MTLPARLTGVIPPVCTPLTPDHQVDTASLVRLVDHLIDGGVSGLFVLGSTSEVAYLPDGHRRVVLDTVVGHVAGRLPVLAGVIDMTTLRVIDHVRTAVAAGVDGIVVTAPFYTRTHPAEIDNHFRMVAAAAGLPVFAYDLPVAVHSKLGADLVLQLAADGVLAGLKDSSGDEGGLRNVILQGARPRRHHRLQRADRLRTDRRQRAVDGSRRGGARGSATWTRTATSSSSATRSPANGRTRAPSRNGWCGCSN